MRGNIFRGAGGASHFELRRTHRQGLSGLSNREGQVADLVADGLSNRDIANHLGIALSTVETHMASIFAKLGIDSRITLIRMQAGA